LEAKTQVHFHVSPLCERVGAASRITSATIYYRFAKEAFGALGEQGTNVLVRLSSFILLCIGIEIIWNGYSTLINCLG